MILLLACAAPSGGEAAPSASVPPVEVSGDAPDPSDAAFGLVVHEVALELSEEAVAALRLDRFGWVEGAVVLDGVRYAPVEVRLKSAHGSRREIDEKPGWKVKLDGLAELSWNGLENLTLNNMVQDPSAVREHLAYTLYRASGVPAPRVAWAHVQLNGEDYGLSLLVESADDDFLARWYADPGGALYEGTVGVDLFPGMEHRYEYDEGPDPADRSDLVALIGALDAPPDDAGLARVATMVELDQVLTHLAVEALALHWDGYGNPNNYRLYHDPTTDRFEMLPWGADETFDRVVRDPWGSRGRLARYCFDNPSCRADYDARLLEVADRLDALALDVEARATAAWLRPWIEADPKREYEMARHDEEIDATCALLDAWPDQVRGMVGDGGAWLPPP